jgi:hypothetical protein
MYGMNGGVIGMTKLPRILAQNNLLILARFTMQEYSQMLPFTLLTSRFQPGRQTAAQLNGWLLGHSPAEAWPQA